jgi:hypothetical protein
MLIATNDTWINTEQITNARYTPEKKVDDPDSWAADENGMLPATLTVYFPVSTHEEFDSSFEFTGEAATKIWQLLRSHASTVLKMPSRQKIDYSARDRKREEARAAQAAKCPALDIPF